MAPVTRCDLTVYYTVPQEFLVSNHLDWKHIFARPSSRQRGTGENRAFPFGSHNHESVATFLRHFLRYRVLAEALFSCESVVKKGESNSSAGHMGLERAVKINCLEKFPDCVLVLLRLGQKSGRAACFTATRWRLLTLFSAEVAGEYRLQNKKNVMLRGCFPGLRITRSACQLFKSLAKCMLS